MKTNFNRTIETVEQAKDYLTDLISNNEMYHPDEDASEVLWDEGNEPSKELCVQIDKLMGDVMTQDFDPYKFIVDSTTDQHDTNSITPRGLLEKGVYAVQLNGFKETIGYVLSLDKDKLIYVGKTKSPDGYSTTHCFETK